MKTHNDTAQWFVPENIELEEALASTTHLAIAAHQDDMEIMAYHGILECFGRKDKHFTGVVVANGAGSPRNDLYTGYTDEQMQAIRKIEQKKAAYVGEYAALAMLDYPSDTIKDAKNTDVVDDIAEIVKASEPRVIYTHNLADKHETHVSVALRTICAIRKLPADLRPQSLYGCEVWRNLDWMLDGQKIEFDVSAHPNLAAALVAVFDSQICGGKRYDKATEGRRVANATYSVSHGVDTAQSLMFAMDLTPLIKDDSRDIAAYVTRYIADFCQDVRDKLEKLG